MNTKSEQRLGKVHPLLADKVRMLIADMERAGTIVEVVQGLRTHAEQAALYAQGRTKPGPIVTRAKAGYSNHNFGLAVDLCPFKDGKPDWDDRKSFLKIGQIAQSLGLAWGGSWQKFVDLPHVELPGLTIGQCRALFEQGGLAKVWAAVS